MIKLAPKTGSLEFIGNWRPIIIVCVDYKIIAKMKAKRIKKSFTLVLFTRRILVFGRQIY